MHVIDRGDVNDKGVSTTRGEVCIPPCPMRATVQKKRGPSKGWGLDNKGRVVTNDFWYIVSQVWL